MTRACPTALIVSAVLVAGSIALPGLRSAEMYVLGSTPVSPFAGRELITMVAPLASTVNCP